MKVRESDLEYRESLAAEVRGVSSFGIRDSEFGGQSHRFPGKFRASQSTRLPIYVRRIISRLIVGGFRERFESSLTLSKPWREKVS